MLKGFDNVKSNSNNPLEVYYKEVEYQLENNIDPTLPQIRGWFIYSTEKFYDTKMLGTNIHYCTKTLKTIKEKYKLSNYDLCIKLKTWRQGYEDLGYNNGSIFDFSTLNTNWIIEKLNKNISNGTKQTTYQNDNINKIDTRDRRI